MIRIALDGPSGAGKSTVAKAVAKKLGIIYVDTGALYRAIGLYVQRQGVDKSDNEKIISMLGDIKVDLAFNDGVQTVLLNGEDVGGFIRTGEIAMYASAVSAIPEVRAFLLETQRKIARENSVIMDGRDIGTVIIPDANVKIYLVASAKARAERRYKELIAKGEDTTLEKVLADIKLRDKNDSTRAVAPAVKAKDAIKLDNSKLDQDQTIEKVLEIVKKKVTRKKKLFYRIIKAIAGLFARKLFRAKLVNPENEVFGEPYIVCSNHTSMADAVLIMASMKNQVSYMAKKEAFKGFGWFFRAMGAIPVDRSGGDVGAIKKTLNVLKSGDSVGIFPQGTRRPYQNPRDTEIKDGVGMLASRAGVGVLPVFVKTKAGKVKLFRKTEIIIGEYIKPEELCFEGLSGKEKYKKISEYVFDKVCLIGENTEEK